MRSLGISAAPMLKGLWGPMAVYLATAMLLFPFMKWYANNPDTFQYLAIAGRYADGSFNNIVNAYWSPLIIWLLVIPLKILSDGIIAFKLVQLAIGAIALWGWHRLLLAIDVGPFHPMLVFAALPFLLAHALLMLTADLLFVCVAFFILGTLVRADVLRDTRRMMALGVAGALWYFSKAFAFPLFITALVILLLFHREKGIGRIMLRNAALSLGVFLLVCAPWILAMSLKYGYFTISEAARFNQTVEVAPMPYVIKQMPLLRDGPHHPPPGAISPWESPGDVAALTPLRPWTDPARYLKVIESNLLTIYYYEIRRQPGAVFLILLLITATLPEGRTLFRAARFSLPLLLMMVLNLGYTAILVHDRYLWLNVFIMMGLTALMLQQMFPSRPRLAGSILALFILFAWKRPVKELLFTEDADMTVHGSITALTSPFGTLRATYAPDHARMAAIEELRTLGLHGPLASLHSPDPMRHAYSGSLHIAYELGLTYHGEILPTLTREQQMQELNEHGIRYFAVWDGMAWDRGKLLLDAAPPAPRVYDLSTAD